ncbi:MAG: SpoIIE family protein phosphatase [Bacteroidales bacterium]|nr:SpoIIE family protein phosphatase [Bacteroidales bacterium]
MKKFYPLLKHAIKVTVLSSLILIVSIISYITWQSHQHKLISKIAKEERRDMTERIWKAKTENYQYAVRYNSAWDDLVDFCNGTSHPDSAWLEDNIGYMLDAYSAAMVAIFDKDGKKLYIQIADGYEDIDFFSLNFVILYDKFSQNGTKEFFLQRDTVLLEYFGGAITTSADNDHKLPPQGFLMLVRAITPEVLEDFRISLGALYTGLDNDGTCIPKDDNNIVISQQLVNYTNNREAYMCSIFENEVENFFDKLIPVFGIFVLMCLFSAGAILLFMKRKIMNPLSKISKSLNEANHDEIQGLKSEPNEFGQIAEMLDKFYLQQEEVVMQNERLKQQSEEIISINNDLNKQRNRLAETNNTLTESISYASRIQRAAVSLEGDLEKLFPDSFVIYIPRDIVSGDWYRVANIRGQRIIVEADCTGHGVPGALLSMLGISALKDILSMMDSAGEEFLPGVILDRMRHTVKTTLIRSVDDSMEMSDGMDITIAVFNTDCTVMKFAAANQSLLVLRGGEVTRLKGDRMPVGNYSTEDSFQTFEFELQKGDKLFFMSDGYKDQTNPDAKKFKGNRLEKCLIENESLSMPRLGKRLIEIITEWRGNSFQLDDITMIGVKVE